MPPCSASGIPPCWRSRVFRTSTLEGTQGRRRNAAVNTKGRTTQMKIREVPPPYPAGMPDAGEVTVWLKDALAGEAGAMDQVMRQMYTALRQIARQQLAGEYQQRTLGATELVNESFLRLFGGNAMPRVEDRR